VDVGDERQPRAGQGDDPRAVPAVRAGPAGRGEGWPSRVNGDGAALAAAHGPQAPVPDRVAVLVGDGEAELAAGVPCPGRGKVAGEGGVERAQAVGLAGSFR
jgi:hypothetical protein